MPNVIGEEAQQHAFHVARARALEQLALQEERRFSIYAEKLLHSTLKFYYQPDPAYHEISLGTMVADACVMDGNGEAESLEIQTGSFLPLRKKLQKYREASERVRVVMPLPAGKRIIWVSPEDGSLGKPNNSPKKGRLTDALKELYFIRDFLGEDFLTLDILLIDMDEYRRQDGWGNGGKRGSHRAERYPCVLAERYSFHALEDYRAFLPSALGESFLAADFAKATRLTSRRANSALHVLMAIGVLDRRSEGRKYVYFAKKAIV